VFSELIGLWAGGTLAKMSQPGTVRLIELGPGGTLMADARARARRSDARPSISKRRH
jgi:SAM-dependent MidA family methyltransferase